MRYLWNMVGKYPVITLCGSTRFKEQFMEAQKRLTLEGNIVISVGLFGHSGDQEVWTEGTKEMLDDMHKRKIDMADAIYVINVGGYKVNPIEVEDAVSAFGLVEDCICIPAKHIVLGTAPKLLYVPKQGETIKPKEIADFLKGRIESYKIPLLYEAVDAIKRTYNGKLNRKAYLL